MKKQYSLKILWTTSFYNDTKDTNKNQNISMKIFDYLEHSIYNEYVYHIPKLWKIIIKYMKI